MRGGLRVRGWEMALYFFYLLEKDVLDKSIAPPKI